MNNKITIEKFVEAFEKKEKLKRGVDFSVGRAGGDSFWHIYLNVPLKGYDEDILLINLDDISTQAIVQNHSGEKRTRSGKKY